MQKLLVLIPLVLISFSISVSQSADLRIDGVDILRPPLGSQNLTVTFSNAGKDDAAFSEFIIFLSPRFSVISYPKQCRVEKMADDETYPIWVVCDYESMAVNHQEQVFVEVTISFCLFTYFRVNIVSLTDDPDMTNNTQTKITK